MPARLTIGLFESYDPRRFHEAHRRALVRAAALAAGFGANLATFGFPFEDLAAHGGRVAEDRARKAPEKRGVSAERERVELRTPLDVARFIAGTTSVAAEAAPLVTLAEGGRFSTFELPKKGFPPQLGTVVLTTEHAQCPRDTSARAIARELVDGRSQLLVFGLGPSGTPPEVREMAAWEWDVTGGGHGLETATALGACVAAVAAHVEAIEAVGRAPHRH